MAAFLSRLLAPRVLCYVVLALLALIGIQSAALHIAHADLRAANAKAASEISAYEAQIARNRATAIAVARAAELRHAAAVDDAARTYETEKADAQRVADRVVLDLRAGALQLRNHWQGCVATASLVSGVVVAASQPDAAADDRRQSAGRIVRAAAECDAQVRGLQAIVVADRAVAKP